MKKKLIQKRRMMSYFIKATHQIIEEEGIDNVTIRKVADIAGYNSATLYNYFEDLDHLIFFASIKYLKEYILNYPNYINDTTDCFDIYLGIWKCFCYYSFQKPKIYYTIFFDKYCSSMKQIIKEYYTIFPQELGDQFKDIIPMFLKENIYDRNIFILSPCTSKGLIVKEHLDEINEMTMLIYQSMLFKIMNNQVDYSVNQAVEKTLKYIKQIVLSFKNRSPQISSDSNSIPISK